MTVRRRIAVSATAERRLAEIAEFTARRFGPPQVAAYRSELTARLIAAAEGHAHLRPLSALSGQPRHAELSVLRAGQHFLILSIEAQHLRLIDIIHTRSDLTALGLDD